MKKTLILVVDRDDDFGAKADVGSPVIGIDDCTKAATALGIADPEDSDTNALFAALHLQKQLTKEHNDVIFEVALICGHQTVGYKSDTILVEQLEKVLGVTNPDSAILVGDGAEDEYIYPIITSRVPVDSVKKVYVKQAPGVEGTLYIFKRMLEDPQKRERFIAPISWVMMIVCAVYIISNVFVADSLKDFVKESMSIFILFMVGLLMMFYAYNIGDRISDFIDGWKKRARRGSVMTVFFTASILVVFVGIVVGIYSTTDIYTERDTERVLLFMIYFIWFLLFSVMIYVFGMIVEGYINSRTIKYTYITFILNTISVGLVISGVFDYLMDYIELYETKLFVCFIEILSGFVLAILATLLQIRMKRIVMARNFIEEESEDEIY